MMFPIKHPIKKLSDPSLWILRMVLIGATGYFTSTATSVTGGWKYLAVFLVMVCVILYGDARAEMAARGERKLHAPRNLQ